MIKPNTKFEKVKKFSVGKFFYITLAVCACLASLLAWKSTNGIVSQLVPVTESTTIFNWSSIGNAVSNIPDSNTDAQEVENKITNIPDDRETESTTETTEATYVISQHEYFSMPLGEAVGKAYSDGALVKNATTGDWRTHNGVDFEGAVGDSVKAINNGVVLSVYDDVIWGTVVEIDHGNKMIAKYCGLGKGSTVSKGDKIKINDKIGNLGTVPIESSENPHLHLEIRVDGVLVNPMTAMGK